MRGLFWVIAAFALAVGVTLALRANEGYALLVLPPYRVEVSLAFLVVLLIAGFFLVYSVVRMLAGIMGLPARVQAFRRRKREERAREAMFGALQALYEGRYSLAEKLSNKAWGLGVTQPQIAPAVSLVAARAAHRVRNSERRNFWLDRADQLRTGHGEDWSQAALTTRAELLLDQRDYEAARTVLRNLNESAAKHVAAQLLLLRAEQGLGHWVEVIRIARLLEKRSGLPPEALQSILVKARVALLQECADEPKRLQEQWREIPERERRQPVLAAAAARAYMQHGDCRSAHAIIEAALKNTWSANLALIYGECVSDDALARIERAEAWLREHPKEWPLLLTLGRLCAQRELWGKARSYIEASIGIQPTRAAHVALAEMFDRIGRTHDANRHFRTAAAADLPTGTAEA